MAAPPSSPPLMQLPAELRNEIWRLVLVEDGNVLVTHAGFDEPGLLRTSKEIRQEAQAIFYFENTFKLKFDHYDPIVPRRWSKKISLLDKQLGLQHPNVCFSGVFERNWANLASWLFDYHSEVTTVALQKESDDDVALTIVSAMFSCAEAMEDKPWPVNERLFLEFRGALIKYDEEWDS